MPFQLLDILRGAILFGRQELQAHGLAQQFLVQRSLFSHSAGNLCLRQPQTGLVSAASFSVSRQKGKLGLKIGYQATELSQPCANLRRALRHSVDLIPGLVKDTFACRKFSLAELQLLLQLRPGCRRRCIWRSNMSLLQRGTHGDCLFARTGSGLCIIFTQVQKLGPVCQGHPRIIV